MFHVVPHPLLSYVKLSDHSLVPVGNGLYFKTCPWQLCGHVLDSLKLSQCQFSATVNVSQIK